MNSEDSLFVCSFKCDNTSKAIKTNCSFEDAVNGMRADKIKNYEVNPYKEFNLVMSTLLNDRNKPFPKPYVFKECQKVCNAAAVVFDDINYIFYNQDFLNNINSTEEELGWVVRSIISHELGHHILDHTNPDNQKKGLKYRRQAELRADYFSAFVLKKIPGSTYENALAGLNSLNPKEYYPQTAEQAKTSKYPILSDRKKAVYEGFYDFDDSPLKLEMFKNIDSIVDATLTRWGRSVILREIDEELSYGNYLKVKVLIENLYNQGITPMFSEIQLEELKKKIDFDLKEKIEINSNINQDDILILNDVYEKLRQDPDLLDEKQKEVFLKSIKELEKSTIKEN